MNDANNTETNFIVDCIRDYTEDNCEANVQDAVDGWAEATDLNVFDSVEDALGSFIDYAEATQSKLNGDYDAALTMTEGVSSNS